MQELKLSKVVFTSRRGKRQTRQNTSTCLRPLSTYKAATKALGEKIRQKLNNTILFLKGNKKTHLTYLPVCQREFSHGKPSFLPANVPQTCEKEFTNKMWHTLRTYEPILRRRIRKFKLNYQHHQKATFLFWLCLAFNRKFFANLTRTIHTPYNTGDSPEETTCCNKSGKTQRTRALHVIHTLDPKLISLSSPSSRASFAWIR